MWEPLTFPVAIGYSVADFRDYLHNAVYACCLLRLCADNRIANQRSKRIVLSGVEFGPYAAINSLFIPAGERRRAKRVVIQQKQRQAGDRSVGAK